jgi:hypothetical protein
MVHAMMANRHDEAGEQDEQKQQALKQLAEDVRNTLRHRSALEDLLGDLEQSHLQGDHVQGELNAIFEECESLFMMARFEQAGELQTALEDATEYDLLESTKREEFESMWSQIEWIAPGVQAYQNEHEGTPRHWTDKDISFDQVHGELVIEHTIKYGVDTVHRIRVPAAKLFSDSVQRLQLIARILPTAIKKDDLTADSLEQILDTQSDLESVLDTLAEISSEAAMDDGGASKDEAESSDDLQGLFETPDNEDDSEGETPSLGIH